MSHSNALSPAITRFTSVFPYSRSKRQPSSELDEKGFFNRLSFPAFPRIRLVLVLPPNVFEGSECPIRSRGDSWLRVPTDASSDWRPRPCFLGNAMSFALLPSLLPTVLPAELRDPKPSISNSRCSVSAPSEDVIAVYVNSITS